MSLKLFSSVVAVVTGLALSSVTAQITIPTLSIGNPGNAADWTGFGAVAYTYNIGTTEVTNAQYVAFLNAKAASDPSGLYNTNMAGSFGGISRSGLAGSYTYGTIPGRENNPVNFVSFWDAARFANWLHNGQGSGDTETGAYTLTADTITSNTVARNAGAQWAVASEDEWYKAAYHQPASRGGDSDNYWRYPTSSNAVTTAEANIFGNGIDNTVPVGSYSANYYGTFDQGGNVWEWNDTAIQGLYRGLRGGSFVLYFDFGLQADNRTFAPAETELLYTGFRVSQVPGPSAVVLLAIGGFGALRRGRCVSR